MRRPAITHGTAQWHPHHQQQIRQAEKLYRSASSPWIPRTTTDIAAWLDGMNVLAPGIVPVSAWRPDDPANAADAEDTGTMAAVAVTR